MSICIMKGCPHRKEAYTNINFFKLPVTYEKRKRWLELCEAEYVDLTTKTPVVCAKHFEPKYVLRNGNKLTLHQEALPIPIESSTEESTTLAIEIDTRPQNSTEIKRIPKSSQLLGKPKENTFVSDIDIHIEECSTLEQDELQSTSSQLELEPADYFDVRCGEVFLNYTGILVFHCSSCEKECGNFYSFVKHLKTEHYSQLREDDTYNEFEQKTDQRLERSQSTEEEDSVCEESVDIKQEEEMDSLDEFVEDDEEKPAAVENPADPLNDIEQILIEEAPPDSNAMHEFESEEKTDDVCDVLSVSRDKNDENIKSISDAENELDCDNNEVRGKKKCETCGKILRNTQVLKRHHEMVHSLSQTCKCDICGLKLKHHSYLKSHMLRHTGEKNIPCDVCSKKFYTISEQRLHLRSHGLTYVRPKPLADKEKISEMVECDICKKTLKNKQTLRKHHDLVHPSSEQTYDCEICGLTLKHFSYIKAHMLRHTGEKNVCCDICSKKFYTLSEQRLHLRTHYPKDTDDGPMETFTCQICKKTFKTKLTLKKHARVHLETERKYKCNICGIGLKHFSYMKRHMERHTGEKTISCEICSKKFYTYSEHKLHLRSHTGERPFVCSSCGLAFTNSGALTVHEKIHKIEPIFRCEYCNKGFYSAYRMRGHMIVHTKEKPFSCPICTARFPRKRSMLRHIGLRHKKKGENNENDEEIAVNSS